MTGITRTSSQVGPLDLRYEERDRLHQEHLDLLQLVEALRRGQIPMDHEGAYRVVMSLKKIRPSRILLDFFGEICERFTNKIEQCQWWTVSPYAPEYYALERCWSNLDRPIHRPCDETIAKGPESFEMVSLENSSHLHRAQVNEMHRMMSKHPSDGIYRPKRSGEEVLTDPGPKPRSDQSQLSQGGGVESHRQSLHYGGEFVPLPCQNPLPQGGGVESLHQSLLPQQDMPCQSMLPQGGGVKSLHQGLLPQQGMPRQSMLPQGGGVESRRQNLHPQEDFMLPQGGGIESSEAQWSQEQCDQNHTCLPERNYNLRLRQDMPAFASTHVPTPDNQVSGEMAPGFETFCTYPWPPGWECEPSMATCVSFKDVKDTKVVFDGEPTKYRGFKEYLKGQVHNNASLNVLQRSHLLVQMLENEPKNLICAEPTNKIEVYAKLLMDLDNFYGGNLMDAFQCAVAHLEQYSPEHPETLMAMISLFKKAQTDLGEGAESIMSRALSKLGELAGVYYAQFSRAQRSFSTYNTLCPSGKFSKAEDP